MVNFSLDDKPLPPNTNFSLMRKLLLFALLPFIALPAGAVKKSSKEKAFNFGASHIITFTPISGIVSYGNFNPGVGFDYEYIVSKSIGMGIHIPVMFGFDNGVNDVYNNSYTVKNTCFFTAPGIRFHTGKMRNKVDFATGPSVLLGNMHFHYSEYGSGNSGSPLPSDYNYSMVGLVADNSLNVTKNKFIFALNVKVGSMLDKHEGTHFFMQFGIQLGGIF